MRVYVAGPMRNLPEFNFPAFHAAAEHLRNLGHIVLSPAERDLAIGFDPTSNSLDGFDVHAALNDDFCMILDCDAIALLPGWETSTGARAERFVAEMTGKHVLGYDSEHGLVDIPPWDGDPRVQTDPFYIEGMEDEPEFKVSVLDEANDLIYGDRNQSYGHPRDDYQRTVSMFNAWRGPDATELTVEDGIAFMTFVKLSRQRNRAKRDNLVDAAGYVGCWARVVGDDD